MTSRTPEKQLEYGRRYRARHRDKVLAKKKAAYQANKEAHKAGCRRRKGLPEPTRPRPDVCEICGTRTDKRALAVDHCHVLGHFCGWLCMPCNRGLGFFKENPRLLQAAMTYLVMSGKAPKP